MIDESIPLAQQAQDTAYLGKNYLDLAIVFKNTQQYDKATTYLKDAINTLSAHHSTKATNNSTLNLINAYTTLAENYVLGGNYVLAKPVLDSARAWLTRKPNEHLIARADIAGRSEGVGRGEHPPTRHGRACPGHPRMRRGRIRGSPGQARGWIGGSGGLRDYGSERPRRCLRAPPSDRPAPTRQWVLERLVDNVERALQLADPKDPATERQPPHQI